MSLLEAVTRFLGVESDDEAAALALDLDVESVRDWRAWLTTGPVSVGIDVDDHDGDGDAEPRFRVRWNGKRHVRERVVAKPASKKPASPKRPKLKRDKRGVWRTPAGRILRQRPKG